MPIIYNNKKLIPAPLLRISKEYQFAGNGEKIGSIFVITLQGKIVAYKGSPHSTITAVPAGFDGYFWTNSGYPPDETLTSDQRLAAILYKQELIRRLFKDEGKTLEITPLDGGSPITCNPRVRSIEFAEGIWFDQCDYTITLEADRLYGIPGDEDGFTEFIQDASEEWSLEPEDNRVLYRLTHTVSAVGKRSYDENGNIVKEPWKTARDYVTSRLGLDDSVLRVSGSINLPTYYEAYNYGRAQNIGELAGSFSVTETWVISSGTAFEEFTVETRESAEDGRKAVAVNGTVTGFDLTNNQTAVVLQTRYNNALSKFNVDVSPNVWSRAKSYANTVLNPVPLNKVIGHNITNGIITYAYDFDDRPKNCISGSLSEVITITDNHPSDVFAEIPVLGRAAGPVLQSISTYTSRKRSLSIEVVMSGGRTYNDSEVECSLELFNQGKPDFTHIIEAVKPAGNQVFTSEDTESWNPIQKRATRNLTWTYET